MPLRLSEKSVTRQIITIYGIHKELYAIYSVLRGRKTLKLHGGHEEVEEGDQMAVDGGEADLEDIPPRRS
jgi:hypothetical protein